MYPDYLVHYNKNHSPKNGQFTSGDGDGDGIANDHAARKKESKRLYKQMKRAGLKNGRIEWEKWEKDPAIQKLANDKRIKEAYIAFKKGKEAFYRGDTKTFNKAYDKFNTTFYTIAKDFTGKYAYEKLSDLQEGDLGFADSYVNRVSGLVFNAADKKYYSSLW